MLKLCRNVFCFLLLCFSRFLLQAEGVPASALSLGLEMLDNDVNDVMCHVRGCYYDLQLYCLSNGAIVLGSCSLKQTLCSNGQRNEVRVASSWSVCWEATYTVDQRNPGQKIDIVKESQPSTDDSLPDETQFSAAVKGQPPIQKPLPSPVTEKEGSGVPASIAKAGNPEVNAHHFFQENQAPKGNGMANVQKSVPKVME